MENLLTIFSNLENFVDVFGLFFILTFFVLVSSVACAKIPLCAENSLALVYRVWHEPYYAAPQKSWHNYDAMLDMFVFGIACRYFSSLRVSQYFQVKVRVT